MQVLGDDVIEILRNSVRTGARSVRIWWCWGGMIFLGLGVWTPGSPGAEEGGSVDEVEAKEWALDEVTGMKMAPGWEIVRNNCITCHSAQGFLRQKGTLTTWTEIIRWMQQTQNLWVFDEATEETILTYLAENYGPSGEYRRAPIPATLMPKNPYVSAAQLEYEEKVRAGDLEGADREEKKGIKPLIDTNQH
jgi:hypothetical protein